MTKSDPGFFYYGIRNMHDSLIITHGNAPVLRTRPEIGSNFEVTYDKEGYGGALNWLVKTLAVLSEPEPVNAAPIVLLYQLSEN